MTGDEAEAQRLRHNYLERVAPARRAQDSRALSPLVRAGRAFGLSPDEVVQTLSAVRGRRGW